MNDSSLIPEEYVSDRREVRRTFLGIALFAVVMAFVIGAFLVTNRQWDSITERRAEVVSRFEDVKQKIERMEELRGARDDLVQRAELASALVARVPRSTLLSGLVERMPPRVSWTRLDLVSKEIREPIERIDARNDRLKPRGPTAAPVNARGPEQGEADRPRPKRYQTSVVLTGLAPDEVDVSMYVAALQEFSMLKSVMPDSTEIIEVDDVPMRKFKITMQLDPDGGNPSRIGDMASGDRNGADVLDRMATASDKEGR